ncbi:hypothetical protein BU26DRAFT_175354 [Trematosphaeria pertusa]|uniref:Uncharacterized protein n=1 Tax=Trematosphaeria pertusa TaxID=390896 RepID=A0A6A6HUT2_9PLEO|nr:uncharacterized protein BU26DRAFT_175354 [Trematosphaeria pertusa]KAF2241649.1 hypothetical protein BU26DRAFT_175354 [Trematosphaeria pertusa]
MNASVESSAPGGVRPGRWEIAACDNKWAEWRAEAFLDWSLAHRRSAERLPATKRPKRGNTRTPCHTCIRKYCFLAPPDCQRVVRWHDLHCTVLMISTAGGIAGIAGMEPRTVDEVAPRTKGVSISPLLVEHVVRSPPTISREQWKVTQQLGCSAIFFGLGSGAETSAVVSGVALIRSRRGLCWSRMLLMRDITSCVHTVCTVPVFFMLEPPQLPNKATNMRRPVGHPQVPHAQQASPSTPRATRGEHHGCRHRLFTSIARRIREPESHLVSHWCHYHARRYASSFLLCPSTRGHGFGNDEAHGNERPSATEPTGV